MQAIDYRGITAAFSKCGLAVGTTSTITAATATTYAIQGVTYTKTLGSNQTHPTTDANTGAAFVAVQPGYGCALVYGFDTSGNLVCVQGNPQALVGSTDGSNAACKFITAPNFGPIPDDFCPVGYVILKVGSAVTNPFTPGTTAWNTSNVGTAAVSVTALPPRPQVA